MAQGSPLNAPTGTNNLLALVLEKASQGRGDIAYCDTGEPAAVTETATNPVLQINFPVNGVGNQPPVSQGAFGLIISSVGTQTFVGPITIEAVDSTATNAGNAEVVETIPEFPLAAGGCILKTFAASLAAGADSANGPLANVIGLRASITLSGTTPTCSIKFAAAGTP